MAPPLLKTPLHAWHASHGGKLVEFGGWEMPVHYGSIITEHKATRNAVGLFDVSHMARFRIGGSDAKTWLDRMLTRRVTDMPRGRVRYTLVLNDLGQILDDCLVYRLPGADPNSYYFVANAGNRIKIWDWFSAHRTGDVQLADETFDTVMISVQGPQGVSLASELWRSDFGALANYYGGVFEIHGVPAIVSRTGYTGEDGVEVIAPATIAKALWESLVEKAISLGGACVGLGARDTLRLEAAMPLYGHELSESIPPGETGLGFAMQPEGRDFLGRAATTVVRSQRRRVGLSLDGKRVAREGYEVIQGNKPIGVVTSGTFSPTLERSIAMAYVQTDSAEIGSKCSVDIRGQLADAIVVELPFYRRK